jgi:hypothetical protein
LIGISDRSHRFNQFGAREIAPICKQDAATPFPSLAGRRENHTMTAITFAQEKEMKRLRYFATAAALAIGVALSPVAFAHGGGGGGHGGGGGFHGGGMAGDFHGGGFHGGFHGGRPVFGYGFGYPYPVEPDYCSQYPNGYNPAAGCYYPYS